MFTLPRCCQVTHHASLYPLQRTFVRHLIMPSKINVTQVPSVLKPNQLLYQHQAQLPSLPVPSLEATLTKYLMTLKPLLSDLEFQQTQQIVDTFQQKGGIGETLQSRLLQRYQTHTKTSWLYEWWNEYAYFGYRDPVVINVNYFFHFKDDPRRTQQVARAASLIRGVFEFRKKVVDQTLEPEKARDAPLCSIQYRALFHACRIPAKPVDHVVGYDPEKCFHIVVMRNNRFFVFDIIRPSTGAPLTEDELQIQLKRILDLAGTQTALPLGVLTTSHRDTWSDLRTQLLHAHPSHPGLFETLESAMCVLCLDTTSPKTLEDMARTCWHGDGRNRWFDKSFQLIVCENGKAGFNGEHSLMDATVTGRLCESILTHCFSPSSSSSSESLKHPQGHHDLPAPKELVFQLTSFQSSIESAQYQFDQLVQAHEVQVLAFHGFGKDAIKQWGMSPDAFVQMALQLAYYKMYGHWRATYETAQTRKFKYGRTETGRTVSLESVAFLKGMCSPTLTAPQKIKLLKSAAQYHHRYMTDASEGKGVDRHLLGLKLSVLPNEPIPDVFSHPSFKASSHWALSTSQLTSELFDGYGWGPVVTDGYGLAYMIKRKSIHVNIACQHLRADRFRQYLIEALQDMKKLFDDAPETNKSKL